MNSFPLPFATHDDARDDDDGFDAIERNAGRRGFDIGRVDDDEAVGSRLN
jgi:hypothetical protein